MKMHRLAVLTLAITGICPSLHADLSADQTPFHSYRGLWVSRFEYSQNNSSIDAVFANAQAWGITDVMFQVRGRADAFYNSAYEYRTSLSYDSLARAVAQGAARGIKVHAWLNTMPLWSGNSLPTNQPGNNPYLINAHPEYWIRDSANNPQPLNDSYVTVNPTMPEVKQHIWNVVDDITTKYNVAGIHLDYIRLLNNTSGSNVTYPTDPATVARFQAVPGNAGKTPTSHSAEYKQWIADEITTLVAGVRETMKDNRPTAQLTAAVWRDADIGFNSYQQEWSKWVDRGLLDAAMPMIYREGFGDGSIPGTSVDSGNLYRNNVTSAVNWRGNAGIMPGLGPYMQESSATAYGNFYNQLVYAAQQGANGVQLFSYTDLNKTGAIGDALRQAWADFRANYGIAAPSTTITDFEANEGYFPTNITFSGSNVNVAGSSTADRDTTTAAVGSASQKLTINKTVGAGTFLARHLSGIGTAGSPGSNLTFASIGSLGFWLKTDTADLEVAVAVDDFSDNTSSERGYFQNVIPDGQWHFYQWMLNDVSHWDAWAGDNTDGTMESLFTLDSVQFRGTAGSNVVFLDEVIYNPSAVAANQWSLNSAINLNAANTNWSNASNWLGGVPNGVGAVANLLRRPTAGQTVSVTAPITLGTLKFDNLNSYSVQGAGTITMDVASGSTVISVVNRGSHTVAAPLKFNDAVNLSVDHAATLNLNGTLDNSTGKAITKTGAGTLVIGGAQSHGTGSSFTASAGTSEFNTSATGSKLGLTVNAGARVNLNASQQLSALNVSSGGSVDLKTSVVTVDYTGVSPLQSFKQMMTDGRLISSSLTGTTLLVAGEAGDLFVAYPGSLAGLSVPDATTAIVRVTIMGDVSMDGTVNSSDFTRLVAGYGINASARWTQGDLDGNGAVNTLDFNLLAAHFGSSVPTPLLGVVVPEPAGMGLLGAMLLPLVRRVRRAS